MTDTLTVHLRVEPAVERIVLAASADGGTFGRVPGLHVRVVDAADGTEVARFESQGATVETAYVLGELYRRQGAWKFRAVGQGYAGGPEGLATDFGITVDEPQRPQPAAAPSPAPPRAPRSRLPHRRPQPSPRRPRSRAPPAAGTGPPPRARRRTAVAGGPAGRGSPPPSRPRTPCCARPPTGRRAAPPVPAPPPAAVRPPRRAPSGPLRSPPPCG